MRGSGERLPKGHITGKSNSGGGGIGQKKGRGKEHTDTVSRWDKKRDWPQTQVGTKS